jgi:hypothetical protein
MVEICPSEVSGVTTQKIVFIIVTAVRISNPKYLSHVQIKRFKLISSQLFSRLYWYLNYEVCIFNTDNIYYIPANTTLFPAGGVCCVGRHGHLQVPVIVTVIVPCT